MFKLQDQHIGDPWFFIDADRAHLWFLTQPTSLRARERGWHWDVGHAQGVPQRIYAGQVVRWRGKWSMTGLAHKADLSKGEAIAEPIAIEATAGAMRSGTLTRYIARAEERTRSEDAVAEMRIADLRFEICDLRSVI